MIADSDTQVNQKFVQQWAWIPAAIKSKFTPTSVATVLMAAFSCGGVAATYRARFHESESARHEDHKILIRQTDAVFSITVQLAHLDSTLQGLDKRLSLQEQWQQKVTGVAETINVPKQSHRAHRQP